jgi:hypothetical protein
VEKKQTFVLKKCFGCRIPSFRMTQTMNIKTIFTTALECFPLKL